MIMKNITINLICLASLQLSACGIPTLSENGKTSVFSPKPLFLRNLPQTDDNYSQGFRDGCYNFIGQTGFGFQRMYDRPPRATDELFMDRLYQRGYTDGDRYCSAYVNHDIFL